MLFVPTIGTQYSGKMGGLVAAHGPSGPYFRFNANPTNPATPQQTVVRNALGNLVATWQTLTDFQRGSWESYAANVPTTNRIGATIFLTGQQWFVGVNTLRLQAGLSLNPLCSSVFSLSPLTLPTVAPSEASQVLTVTYDNTDEWATTSGGALLIYVGREKSVTTNFFAGPYQFAGAILGDTITPPTSPDVVIESPFPMTEGNRLFVRAVGVVFTGRRTTPVKLDPVLVAA